MIQVYPITKESVDDRTVNGSAELLLQTCIQLVVQYVFIDFSRTTVHLMVDHKLEIMGATVISRQEEQIVTLPHLLIESVQ